MGFLNFLQQLKQRNQLPVTGDDTAVRPPKPYGWANDDPQPMVEQQPTKLGTQVYAKPPEQMPSQDEFMAQRNAQATSLAVPPSAMNQPMPETSVVPNETPSTLAVSPYTQRRMEADEALYNAQNKDWKGKDRDKDHNWWDSVKTGLLGAGKGFLQGGLGGAIIGGGAGAIRGALDRNADEKFINENITLPRLAQTAGVARDAETNAVRIEGQQRQNDWLAVRPQIEQQKADTQVFRAEVDREHKQNQIALGTKKADEIRVYHEAIVNARERGLDQNDSRIKLLEKQIEETKRRNTEAEKDKDFDREARIKVAQIMSQTQITTTGMREQGQNNRQQIAISAQQKLTELKNLQEQEAKETDFNRKQQLQTQRQQAQADLLRLRKQLAGEEQ